MQNRAHPFAESRSLERLFMLSQKLAKAMSRYFWSAAFKREARQSAIWGIFRLLSLSKRASAPLAPCLALRAFFCLTN
ncbi:MAG: hypothetical protein LBC18_10955 [Opitutaceae bacterium]|jgi:hypothetical protein|nr:hypothetical protein [Opitutaceae bacterium]